jgi:hypothetical protein
MATSGPYEIGEIAVLLARLTDPVTRAPVVPDAVWFLVQYPNGTARRFDAAADSAPENAGIYTVPVPCDQAGIHYYELHSSDDHRAARAGSFTVRASRVTAAPSP